MDIATLAFRVDSSGLIQGEVHLEKLGVAAEDAEKQAEHFRQKWNQVQKETERSERSMGSLRREVDQLGRSIRSGNPAAMSASLGQLGSRAAMALGPIGYLGAGILGLAYAYEKGMEEQLRFERSLEMTGHKAGVTGQHLSELAARYDELEGVTQRHAAAAIASASDLGQFTSEQLEMAVQAALKWERATGASIDSTMKNFAMLQKDPIEGLLKLNEQMNFLTRETYEQAKAFEESGNYTDLAALAMRTYDQVIADRTPKITENLGYIERALRAIKDTGAEAIDSIWSIGREATNAELGDRIRMWEADIARMPKNDVAARRARQAQIDQARAQLAQRGVDAAFAFEAGGQSVSTETFRREEEEERRRNKGPKPRAPRELPNFARGAVSELQKLMEAEMAATAKFDEMAATLAGPLAEANFRYITDLEKLRQLASEGAVSTGALAEAEANLARQHQDTQESIRRRLDPGAQMIAELKFELTLMKMTNADRQLAIQLRHLEGNATRLQVEEMRRLNKELENQGDITDGMDGVRRAGVDLLTDWGSQAASIGDAMDQVLERMRRRMIEIAAERLMEKILGQFGTTETGAAGSWWGAMASALFGKREYGGSVYSRGMYQVGERDKPELLTTGKGQFLIPGDNGRVDPIRAAPVSRGGAMGTPQIKIELIGAPEGTTATARQNSSGGFDLSVMLGHIRKDIAADIASGGVNAAAIKGRFDLRERL